MPGSYLQFECIGKSFAGVDALKDVSFGVGEGRVHALLGQNGAGKSTLLKLLSGVYTPDAGSIVVSGVPQHYTSPMDALARGVSVIYQELQLVPSMTVAENIYLGHLPVRNGWIKTGELLENAGRALSALGEDIDPRTRVDNLSIARRQVVEIAKALSRNSKIIAFDEPTSSLCRAEVERLFDVIRELKRQKRVILYVSHRLEEIFEIADSATVLRDGKHARTYTSLAGVTKDDLISTMSGRAISDIYNYQPRDTGDCVLRVRDLAGGAIREPVSLEVAKGEIVGIFGLVGAGRSELLKLIYGESRASGGCVDVDGIALRNGDMCHAIRNGLVLCPEDRKKEGLIPLQSVCENINLSARRNYLRAHCFVDRSREIANAEKQVRRLKIKTPSIAFEMANLSGGNQQKTILGRWLSEDIKVIMLDEPTRGIDVGARSEIYSIIYDLARSGLGVLVVSSELLEILGLCDRMLVMREGTLVTSLSRQEAHPERVLSLAWPSGASAPDAGQKGSSSYE